MRAILLLLSFLLLSTNPSSGQEILDGTWKLVDSKRTNAATGETVDTLGANPQGYIMYGRDGRMIVFETRSDRVKPGSIDTMTEQQRSQLFSSMLAYAGTYKFDGKTVEHHIDVSWNEIWNGSVQIRSVKKDGDRLIYTTPTAPSPIDGSMGYGTVIWEKMK